MADLDRIKRNVAKMASMNAPTSDIDGYIASEGVTIEQIRNHKFSNQAQPKTKLVAQPKPKIQPKPQSKPIIQNKPQKVYNGMYADILNNPNLTKEQKAAEIKRRGEAERSAYDRENLKAKSRIGLGAVMQGASALPIFKIPIIGSAAGGALFDAGGAIMEGASGGDIAKRAGRGAAVGATVEGAIKAIPVVGRPLAASPVGRKVINKSNELMKPILESKAAKKIGGALTNDYYLTPVGRRKANIAKRRNTPLVDRMNEQQLADLDYRTKPQAELEYETLTDDELEALTRPEQKIQNVEYEPSTYGVNEINTTQNQEIADQINNRVRKTFEQIKDYEKARKELISEYGDIDTIRKTLAEQSDEYGRVENVAMQQAYDRFLEKQMSLSENPYIEYAKNINPRNTGHQKAIRKGGSTNKFVEKGTPSETKIVNEVVEDVPSEIRPVEDIIEEVQTSQPIPQIKPTPIVETPISQQTGKMKQSTLAQKAEKSPEVASVIEENPPLYEAITNAETTAQAQAEIAQNTDKVHTDIVKKLVNNEREFTALDVEKARQLFGELQKQGRYDEATELLELTSKQGSKLGQAVQAFSLWSKTTPDGALLYAQKLLDKYNKGVRKSLQKRLTKEEMREIGEAFQKLNESGLTGRELEVETAKAMKKVFKVVPKTFAQKLDGYRYINMLLSFKSRLKDVALTGKQAFDTAIDESIAGGIDKVRSLVGRDKTRYISANPLTGAKAWLQGAGKGLREGIEDVKYGINTSRSGEVGRYGLPNEPTFGAPEFSGNLINRAKTIIKNPLGSAEKLLRYSMQVPDRMFFEARYASSLANQMKVRGVTEPTQDMINRALEEARRAVFQENRPITQGMMEAVEGLDNRTVRALERDVLHIPQGTLPSVSRSFAPFVKTPTNVIAQGAEGLHGLGSGTLKLRNAIEAGDPEAIREAELLMGRGVRGLGELGLGYAVGKNVWDNIQTNIGNKDYYQNEITGLKPSSVVIGDKAFSMQNMQSNLPFFTGVGLGQRGLGQAYTNTADVIAQMPALKALGDVYNINKEANYIAQSDDPDKELLKKGDRMVRSLGANYLTSLLPVGGEMGEIRNDIDPYARELRDDENTLNYLRNRVVNRIPFASRTLPIKYNAIGEPVMANNIQSPVGRVASEMVDFGIRNYTPDETYNELNQFRDSIADTDITGRTTVGIKKAKKKIRGMDRALTNKEYSDYQKIYGRLSKQLKGELFENNQNLTQEEMAKELQTMTQSIDEATKAVLFGIQPTRKPKKYTQAILDTVDWESLLNNE